MLFTHKPGCMYVNCVAGRCPGKHWLVLVLGGQVEALSLVYLQLERGNRLQYRLQRCLLCVFLSHSCVLLQLLHYVTVSSPEALPLDSRPLDTPVSANCLFSDETETALVDTVHVQHTSEQTQISTTANG